MWLLLYNYTSNEAINNIDTGSKSRSISIDLLALYAFNIRVYDWVFEYNIYENQQAPCQDIDTSFAL